MNKIIPIAIVSIVIVIGIVVISSTGGISSINYASMTCNELTKEGTALLSTTTSTTAESRDQINQLELIGEAYQSKNCEDKADDDYYASLSCSRLLYLESNNFDRTFANNFERSESLTKAIEDKNCGVEPIY